MLTKSMIVKGFLLSFMMTAFLSGCGNSASQQPVTDIAAPESITDSTDLPDASATAASETSNTDRISEDEAASASHSNDKAPDPLPPKTTTTSAALQAETTSAPAAPSQESAAASTASPQESEKTANGKIYEGLYFDESFYQYIDMPQEESPLIYCEITISNVTDTTFDFIINEKVMATGETKNLIPSHTATISVGTSKAVYQGENLTLTFVFPDDENTFPQHLEISGLEQLENKVYINNTIPGHESG